MYQSNIRARKTGHRAQKDEYLYPDDSQSFALCQTMLGNGRVKVLCPDGVVRIGRIRGGMRYSRHKVIVEPDDLLIISGREFDSSMVDFIHKYSHDETSVFIKNALLPEKIVQAMQKDISSSDAASNNNQYVTYADEDDPDMVELGISKSGP